MLRKNDLREHGIPKKRGPTHGREAHRAIETEDGANDHKNEVN